MSGGILAGAGPVLRVGIVGYGVMGKTHCYGYRVAPLSETGPSMPPGAAGFMVFATTCSTKSMSAIIGFA